MAFYRTMSVAFQVLATFFVLHFEHLPRTSASPVAGELHSCPYHLRDVFLFDKKVAEAIRDIIPSTKEADKYLESYAGTMLDATRVGGNVLNEAILGNPLHVYSLIKRMVLYWPRIRQQIFNSTLYKGKGSCQDHEDIPCRIWKRQKGCHAPFMDRMCAYTCGFCNTSDNNSPLKKAESSTVLPSKKDLDGAAQSLALLQQVYLLPLEHLISGTIFNTRSSVRLTFYDQLRAARSSMTEGRWINAWVWLHTALSTLTDPEALAHYSDLVDDLVVKHDGSWANRQWIEINHFPQPLSDVPIQEAVSSVYADLCRGEVLQRQDSSETLQCHVTSRGSPHLLLQPVRIEELSLEPELFLLPEFLSGPEVKIIIDASTDKMERDVAGSGRQSHQTFLENSTNPFFQRLSRRIEAVTGLLAHEGSSREEMAGDPIKVRYYGTGGHLTPHVDVFSKHLQGVSEMQTEEHPECRVTGDRIATFMIYLNDVVAGGRTAFYNTKLVLTPRKGMAVFWYNLKRNGDYDIRMDHGGCPVLLGSKWVAVKWIRENPNFLRRPCTTNPYE